METQNDPLWKIAQKRASFKKGIVIYIIISCFLWAVWYFTTPTGYKWPVWAMLGWGVGLAFSYVDAYHSSKEDMIQKEYDKLKEQKR